MNKDWLLDVAATITAIGIVGIFIEIFKGKFHAWGAKAHGHKPGGAKVKKNAPDQEEELSNEAA